MKRIAATLIAGLSLSFAACGGGGGAQPPPPPVTISISPTSATVEATGTVQFTATVRNTTHTAVTWQVNDVTGGNATVGTVSSTGLYTAPTGVPSPDTVTVKAVSQADSTKSASAQVTIIPLITVTVAPASVTLPAGGTQQFTATVENTSNTAVTWQVNGIQGGNSTVGTITSAGLYTAPLAPPSGGSVTVTAVSQANPSHSGSATVTIVFSNATLNGQYAFNYTALDDVLGVLLAAGTFVADGTGNIANGIQDLNHSFGVDESVPFTGSYTIGPDGRGSATVTNSFGTSEFRFVVYSNSRARILPFATTTVGVDWLFFPETVGAIEKQDTSAFQNSAITGGYALALYGFNQDGSGFLSTTGQFNADGAGTISAGVQDINDAGMTDSNVPFSGSYNVASNGRGTAAVTNASGTFGFSFYVVSTNRLLFVSTDFLPALIGVAEKQSGSFSNSTLAGNYVLYSSGLSPIAITFTAGRFTADGAGSITNGVSDENDGSLISPTDNFTAIYSVSSTGRGTLTVTSTVNPSAGTETFAFVLVSGQRGFYLQTDSATLTSGAVLAQQGSSFNNASLEGSYGVRASGFTDVSLIDTAGQADLDGLGNVVGTLDINTDIVLTPDVAIDGTYSVASTGRTTFAITAPDGTSNFRGYIESGSKVLLIGVDFDNIVIGTLEKQY